MHNYFVIDDKPGYFSINNVNIASSLGFTEFGETHTNVENTA